MPTKLLPRSSVRRTTYAFSAVAAACLATGCGVQQGGTSTPAIQAVKQGSVHGGQQPVQNAVIQLYAVGSGSYGAPSTPLLTSSVTTGGDGSFSIHGLFSCPTPSTLVYLVASGGNPGLAAATNNQNLVLMGAIGRCDSLTAPTPLAISINEVTTVAAVAALAPYMTGYANMGAPSSDSGMPAAFTLAAQLASLSNGLTPGTGVPAGATVPVTLINSLANIVATCVNSSGGVAGDTTPCGRMFSTVQANGYAPATDTVLYLIRIAQLPTLPTAPMFNLIPPDTVFFPQLATAPATFAAGLVYASPLTLSLSNSSFPPTYVGAFAASLAVTISNGSSSAVNLSAVSISEPSGGSDFLASTNCPSTLAASSNCTAWVNFTPQIDGALSSYLAVSSSPETVYAAFSGTALLNPPTTFSSTLNNQTVFIGASICQNWSLPVHNSGVSGDTTAMILARFPAAVLGHGYSTVVIMGGSNDVLLGVDLLGQSIPNVLSMGQMATNAGMQVAIAAIPPITEPGADVSDRVNTLNQGYKQLAIQNGWLYLDFYTPLVGHPEDLPDGLHPDNAGYALLLPVLTANVTR